MPKPAQTMSTTRSLTEIAEAYGESISQHLRSIYICEVLLAKTLASATLAVLALAFLVIPHDELQEIPFELGFFNDELRPGLEHFADKI
jgi:hypothetical protein